MHWFRIEWENPNKNFHLGTCLSIICSIFLCMEQENHIIYFHHCHLITLFGLYLLRWILLSERIILDVSIDILMTFHNFALYD